MKQLSGTPNKLKIILVQKGIGQRALHEKAGVPYNTVSKLCNGDYHEINVQLNTLRKIAHALNTTVLECFEDVFAEDLTDETYFLND